MPHPTQDESAPKPAALTENRENAGSEPTPTIEIQGEEFTTGEPEREKWFVPFVVIPLGIALTILAIVGLANFLLGRGDARTMDSRLEEMQKGGANARKQAAFELARELAEQVEENNRRLARDPKDPAALPHGQLPRKDLARLERALELAGEDEDTRIYLITALGLVGDDETVNVLAKYLEGAAGNDEGGKRRVAVLVSLARIGSERALPIFQAQWKSMRNDPDAGVAQAIAAGFGNLSSKEATQGLLEIQDYGRTHGAELKANPGAGAGKPSDDVHAQAARPSSWFFVRLTAAVNLAKRIQIDPTQAALAKPALMEGLERIAEEPSRPEGERLFRSTYGSGLFATASLQTAESYREDALRQVIGGLLLLKATEAKAALERMSKDDPNLRVRSAALDALAKLGS